MNDLEREYADVIEKRQKVKEELTALEQTETIKRYFKLRLEWDILYNKRHDLYKKIEEERISSCKHILVNTSSGSAYNQTCGCIKCGVDTSILEERRERLSFEEKIKYDYLKNNYIRLKSTLTDITCDLNLAMALYSKIKEHHPNIDDETAIHYFKVALDHIRNVNVNDERKKSRAKRLSLKPTFNCWNEKDI